MISIRFDEYEYVDDVKVAGDTVLIEFTGHEDGSTAELVLSRELVSRICELIPNELIVGYVKAKQDAEKRAEVYRLKMKEAMRRLLRGGNIYEPTQHTDNEQTSHT